MREILILLLGVPLVCCAVLIVVGWRNPSSRFLVGFVQTRDPKSPDPERNAAAACWLVLGFGAGAVGLLVSPDSLLSYACAIVCVACLVVAAWVRWGDAPRSVRPAAMRTKAE